MQTNIISQKNHFYAYFQTNILQFSPNFRQFLNIIPAGLAVAGKNYFHDLICSRPKPFHYVFQ